MLEFEPPRHDAASFVDADLDPVGGLIQSLRWFSGRASLLLYVWSFHVTLSTELKQKKSSRPLAADALYMLERSFRHSVVLEIRAIHDHDPKSLGSGQIANRLGDLATREALSNYLRDYPRGRVMSDEAARSKYLDYIQRYCGIMTAPLKASTLSDHPLSGKTQLVRRAANKSVAHSTLDDYRLGGQDLEEVVMATVAIACAIEASLGDAVASSDFADIETAGYRAAGVLFHVDVDPAPYIVNMIRGFLPAWVATGKEFPKWPSEFRHTVPQQLPKNT